MPTIDRNKPNANNAQKSNANNAPPANASIPVLPDNPEDMSAMVGGMMDDGMLAALAPMFKAINEPVEKRLAHLEKELGEAREDIRILIDMLAGAMNEMDAENQP